MLSTYAMKAAANTTNVQFAIYANKYILIYIYIRYYAKPNIAEPELSLIIVILIYWKMY